MKRFALYIFYVPFLWLCAACVSEPMEPSVDGYGTRIMVGDTLPAFSVSLSDGNVVTRDSLLGFRSVVVFFHTQCPDCQKVLPRIDSLYRIYNGVPDFRFLCIAREEGKESIDRFWSAHGLVLPFSPQPNRSVYRLFAHTGVPRIYIAAHDGEVHYIHDDQFLPTCTQLREEVEALPKP